MTPYSRNQLDQAKATLDKACELDSFDLFKEGINRLGQVLSENLINDFLLRRAKVGDKFGEFARRMI